MKNIISLVFITILFSCEKNLKASIVNDEDQFIENIYDQKSQPIDTSFANKILATNIFRSLTSVNGYDFKLPINYRIFFIPNGNTEYSSFKMVWKISEDFIINSEADGFKRFSVNNFIRYLPTSEEGEIYIIKNKKASLTIDQVLKTADEIFYKDNNSAVFVYQQTIRAFYFEYLPEREEYLIYFSDTPFFNKKPEVSEPEQFDQLLSQLRMAKNIFKPIIDDNKNAVPFTKQLTTLEKSFFENEKKKVTQAFAADKNLECFSPADQGNIKYYTVVQANTKSNLLWDKLKSIQKDGNLIISNEDEIFEFLRDCNFRFFYESTYQLVYKDSKNLVFKRDSSDAFCLITKNKNLYLFKEFPQLTESETGYYDNEIKFYKQLFENFN